MTPFQCFKSRVLFLHKSLFVVFSLIKLFLLIKIKNKNFHSVKLVDMSVLLSMIQYTPILDIAGKYCNETKCNMHLVFGFACLMCSLPWVSFTDSPH